MVDVAVIGAGVGGLSAAIDLASRGHRVVVFEAADEVGGKIGRVVIDDVELDTGPSVLTMVDVLDDLFAAAGVSTADEIDLFRPDPSFRYSWPDGATLDVHFDREATLGSVASTFGSNAAAELADFLAYASRIWEAAAPTFVYGDAPSLGGAVELGLDLVGKLRDIDPMRTMNAAIERRVTEPHLRDVLRRYATYNGSDPWRAPATLNCISHVELTLGGYGVRGGMYELARALERVARRLGVRFELGRRVDRIIVDSDRAVGLRVGGRVVAVDAVVANADVRHVVDDLLPSAATSSVEPSMSAWTGLVRARRRPRPAHSVYFPSDYRQEFRDIFDRGRSPREPTVYACALEVSHARDGWPEHEPLFLMANAPATSRGEPDDDTLREAVVDRGRDAGWLAPEDRVVWERTPSDLAARFPGSLGAIYGGSSNSRLAAFRRPPNRVDAVRGLYLASGSAHPGGGVPLAILSGRAAVRALSDDV